jgi:hypothetical protein
MEMNSKIIPQNAHQPVYVPIAQIAPVFVNAVSIALPAEYNNGYLTPDMWSVFHSMRSITVRQHVKWLPKSCCTCPPCVKKENTYSVYAGLDGAPDNEILRIDEVSDDWNRCCCAPYHPLKLEVRQYIPLPGSAAHGNFSYLQSDFATELAQLHSNKGRYQTVVDNWYKSQPVLMSILRTDGQRCCCKTPCKLLDTFVCFGCCQDGAQVYAGPLQDGKEAGRPNGPNPAQLVGEAIQPIFGGWYLPTLHLRDANQSEPFGTVQGPCCFGGWSEMCCNFKFQVSRYGGPSRVGDLAVITKKKPHNISSAFVELATDADVYTIEFNDAAGLSASQKVTILASQILSDYMWFDGNTEKCKVDDSGITCYLCYYSCIGALCPVYIYIPKGGK